MTQPVVVPPPGRPQKFQQCWAWIFMIAVLVMVAAARLRLLDFPLERDEGEYAYAGQLILQGIPPYELAYNMKFPGIYAAYALMMAVFGQTPAGIHLGVMCMTTLTALMLYWLGKKILDPTAGITAATAYAVFAASHSVLGLAGHATHFAAFFATAGLCVLWKTRQNPNRLADFAAGLLFGTALLMKQHAAFIGLWAAMAFSMACLRQPEIPIIRRLRAVTTFGAGMVLPFGLCCLVLWHAGVFGRFWFWTIDYAREYAFLKPFSSARDDFLKVVRLLISTEFPWWPLVAAGCVWFWLDQRLQPARFWLGGFFVASVLTVFPGYYFRMHYFLLTLPAVALLIGCATSGMRRLGEQKLHGSLFLNWPMFVYALFLAATTYVNYAIWFAVPLPQAVRMVYMSDTLLEAPVAAAFIRTHSPPSAHVVVLGSEPEIYFLSHRHSGTGYIYVYPLMEPQRFAQKMQDEMIREIETDSPEFVVYADNFASWMRKPESSPEIFNWWASYRTNYTLVGLADSAAPGRPVQDVETLAHFGGRLSGFGFEIYQRKPGARNSSVAPTF